MKGRQHLPSEDSFTAFAVDQLRGLGAVEARVDLGASREVGEPVVRLVRLGSLV